MLYSVRVGSRQAVPNKLIWFSDAVLLFVVEWRQNSYLDDDDDLYLTTLSFKRHIGYEETEHRKADRTVGANCFVFSNISSGTA